VWWLKTKINDVEPLLMDVCGCAVRLSGWPKTPEHRSKRFCEASRAVLTSSKLYLD